MVDFADSLAATTAWSNALVAGIIITSTSTPSLNGAIPLDGVSIDALQKMVAGIAIFNALPTGTTTFEYPPGSGKMWTQAQFMAMAQFAWQFAYACEVALATAIKNSAAFVAPANTVTIP